MPVGGVPVSGRICQIMFVPAGRLAVPVRVNVSPVFLSPMGSIFMTPVDETGAGADGVVFSGAGAVVILVVAAVPEAGLATC